MALEFYVEQADRSPQSGVATEEVYAGELVYDGPEDGLDVLTFADGNLNVGLARYDAEEMAAETDEDVVEEVYSTGGRVQFQPLESAAILKVRTVDDTGADAPSIGHRDVVGIVDETDGDAPSSAGRIVEEGYSNGSTTFNRSNSNFKAVGRAYRPANRAGEAVTEYDDPVRVIVFGELQEN